MESRRTIARRLESIDDFENPSPSLEQYFTPPEIAGHMLHLAWLQGDFEDTVVLDLGTGTGMFAIGATFARPRRVLGIDVDRSALDSAYQNEQQVRQATEPAVEWVHADVTKPPLSVSDATVFSNPPFGAQYDNRHADRDFLTVTAALADVSYTIHNEGSKEFIESFVTDTGGTVTHAFRATIPLDHRFDFHRENTRELDAEVFRIDWADEITDTVLS